MRTDFAAVGQQFLDKVMQYRNKITSWKRGIRIERSNFQKCLFLVNFVSTLNGNGPVSKTRGFFPYGSPWPNFNVYGSKNTFFIFMDKFINFN